MNLAQKKVIAVGEVSVIRVILDFVPEFRVLENVLTLLPQFRIRALRVVVPEMRVLVQGDFGICDFRIEVDFAIVGKTVYCVVLIEKEKATCKY